MRRWLQTIAELAAAALVHGAILTAVGFAAAERAAPRVSQAPRPAPSPEEPRDARVRRLQLAGPGKAAESGRRTEEMPGFPVPVAAQDAPEGRAVRLPAVAPEQVLNAAEGERSTRKRAPSPAPVPRPELAEDHAQLARGAKGAPEWELPGQRPSPLQIFPSPLPGPAPGQPAVQRHPPSGGSPRDAKLAMRGANAAPLPSSAKRVEAAADHAARAEAPPGPLALATRRAPGQTEAPEPGAGGGLKGLTPTRPEAPVAGMASDGAADGKPAGAAARGADLAPEEQRDAQARPEPKVERPMATAPGMSAEPNESHATQRSAEPQSGTAEQSGSDPVAGVASAERAAEEQAPPSSNAADARRRSGATVPLPTPDESKRGAFSSRSSDDERLAAPERESRATSEALAPAGERETSASARARAPVGDEEIPATRKMDEPRPGDPAPRHREQAEAAADPLTTGPTDGARMTGPPGRKEAPGPDPLARAGMNAETPGDAPDPRAPPTPESATGEPSRAAPQLAGEVAGAAEHPEPADLAPVANQAPGTAASASEPPPSSLPAAPRPAPHRAEEPSPPDPRDLPTLAEAPQSHDDLGPHVPRLERNPEDHPAADGVPGGADSQQPVLLAMAPQATHSALEGASTKLALPGDDRLDSAQRALASANQLLELAAMEGGEVGARHAAEAAAALAAAEEKLQGLEAPNTTQPATPAPPQAGAVTDLPQGGGLGDSPGSPRLGGDSRLNALAQGRVNYVVSLVGPSVTRWAGREGTGRVDFRVDERGYVREVAIRRSTGDGRLDGEIEPTLHLAEPFATTPGWISVVVRFRTAQ